MSDFYIEIVKNIRGLIGLILEPKLDLDHFLNHVAQATKALNPGLLEARVYEVNIDDSRLFLKSATNCDVNELTQAERILTIQPQTITGDAVLMNQPIVASKQEGYFASRFSLGEDSRAAFPIDGPIEDSEKSRTKYVLVVDKKVGEGPLWPDTIAALKDYSVLAGMIISIKEFRDKIDKYHENNRNLVLTGQHSAAIAHDIRSLNVGTAGFLNLALKRKKEAGAKASDPKSETKMLNMALDNSKQIEALLDNFAMFNQADFSLHRNTDLAQVVRKKMASLMNRSEYERTVDFEMSLPGEATGILVDPDWFGTVLENLVKNSFEAGDEKCRVRVEVRADSQKVMVVFEDDSGGIPPEILPNIFTPFYTDKKRGQGLGLANVRKVVEDHEGTISVENSQNGGAIFRIEFPV